MTDTDEERTTASTEPHLPDVPDTSALPGGNSTDDVASIDRRNYLKALGAAGAAGSLAGAASGSAAAQEDWEAEAEERIEEHRKGDLEVTVVTDDDQAAPISGADVEIEMQEHEFGFGTAVDARELNNSSPGEEYYDYVEELFNTAVLENMHKWRFWEDNKQVADDATDTLLEMGHDVRGHVAIWGARQHNAVPSDVETAIDNENGELIDQRAREHIEEIITHYGDDISEWEVVNEAMHEISLFEGYYGDQVDSEEPWNGEVVPWTSDLLSEWYLHAEEIAAEYDVGVAVNDYNTLGGDWPYIETRYPNQIESLLDDGVDLSGIGFQSHIAARDAPVGEDNDGPDERMSYEQINAVLDRYADYGAGLKITEFDTYEGNDWSGDQEKADTLYTYLKTFFAHPEAEEFLMWGIWDGNHWQDDAPLFYQDWSEKPAYDVWTSLVFEDWWTEESGTTDGSGTYATSAFHGEHEVTVTTSEETVTETIEVTDADGTTTVEIAAAGEGEDQVEEDCADAAGSETLSDGQTVCDVDGDGNYMDVTGDGSVSNSDVTEFFGNQHVDPWDSRTDLFDFTGDGDVSQADVVELFSNV